MQQGAYICLDTGVGGAAGVAAKNFALFINQHKTESQVNFFITILTELAAKYASWTEIFIGSEGVRLLRFSIFSFNFHEFSIPDIWILTSELKKCTVWIKHTKYGVKKHEKR